MVTYNVKKVSGVPDWDKIPKAVINEIHKFTAGDVSAYAQLCYTDSELIVHLCAKEKNIRAEESGPLAEACSDSCLEFFFSPDFSDDRYFNIEFSASGAMFLGFGRNIPTLMRLIPETPDILGAKTEITETGFTVDYKVPFWFVRQFFPSFSPAKGTKARANFYKCGDKTDHEHYLSWSKIVNDSDTFHTPKDFGTLIFD